MRVLIVALGSAGDVHPNVGIGVALKRRGHDVHLIAPAVFAPLAQRVGLAFMPLGTEEEFREALRDPDLWHPYKAFPVVAKRLMLPLMRPVFDAIGDLYEPGETIVTAPSTALGARIAQEKHGIPLATIHLQPSLLRSVYDPPCFGFPDIIGALPRPLRGLYLKAVDRVVIDRMLLPDVHAFRSELGLPAVSRLFDRWFHSPELVIALFPEWLAKPQPDWPPNVRCAGFPLYDESDARLPQRELAEFLDGGPPPVLFTAGSANAFARDFFRESVEACHRSGWRGVLLTQFPEQLPPDLPQNVRHFHYVPFSEALPRAAAFVHHGGVGTMAQSFAAGVPQLVVPLAHDQPDNALRVRRLGVGDLLRPSKYKATEVCVRLTRLMESETVRENCRRWAADLKQHAAIEDTCSLLEDLHARNSRRPDAGRLQSHRSGLPSLS